MTYGLLGRGRRAFLPLSPSLLWRCSSPRFALVSIQRSWEPSGCDPQRQGGAPPGLAIPAALPQHCRHSGRQVASLLDLVWDFCHACGAQPSCPSCFCDRDAGAKVWAVWGGRGAFADVFSGVEVLLPASCCPGGLLAGIKDMLPLCTFSLSYNSPATTATG